MEEEMSDNALTKLEQKTVVFYDDEITAVLVEVEGRQKVYVPVRPICDFLGVSWSGQLRRINRDPVLSVETKRVNVTFTDSRHDSMEREVVCLPLDLLNGFLFGLNPTRAKPEVRERLVRYQRECYRILADAFLEMSESEDWMTTDPETRIALRQIEQMGLAIAEMARDQLKIMARLDKAAVVVGQHSRRITVLEQKLAPREAITDEQAADIGQKVKAVAMTLTEGDKSKNHFQSIFNELHRRFRVSSYKNIRQSQYQGVLDFLDDWLAASE
jgi:hypothetical protein